MLKSVHPEHLDQLLDLQGVCKQSSIASQLGFKLGSFSLHRFSQRFGVEVESDLSESQLREVFARELIPIEPEGLVKTGSRNFEVTYSERVSFFAGSFFAHLFLDNITGGRHGNVGGLLDKMVETESDVRIARFASLARYYWDVDMRRLDNVLSLLEGAAYERANQLFPSAHEVAEFFTKGRKVQLVHAVSQILACDKLNLVWGDFIGYGQDGTERRGQFSDVWEYLPERSKPFYRQSYLRTPEILTQVNDYPLEGPGKDPEVEHAVVLAARLALRLSDLKPAHQVDRKFHSIRTPIELGPRLQMTELHARQGSVVLRGLWRSKEHPHPVPVFHLFNFDPGYEKVESSNGYYGLGAGYVQK